MEETQSPCRDVGITLQTEIRGSVFIFNWVIQNISKLSHEEVIKSPTFKISSTHELKAEYEYIEGNGGSLWFYLISGQAISIEHDVSIINNNGKVLLNEISTQNYSLKTPEDILPDCSDVMEEVRKDNTLTFKCVLKFVKTHHHLINQNPVFPLDDMSALTQDLKFLYEAPHHSDITLRIGDCTVPAHKSILSARSSVFARMFQTPMEEAEKNIVDIPDLDPTTVRGLVSYLYTAVLPCDDFDSAYSLYYAGDKYNVPSLRAACRCVMLGKMDVLNACRVLSLADQHSDADLRDRAMRFVDFHFEDVLKTESWAELVKSSSALAVEVAVFCSGRHKTYNEKGQE